MKIVKNREKCKSHFNYLVEKAKLIKKKVERDVDYIFNPFGEEITINSHKYYILN